MQTTNLAFNLNFRMFWKAFGSMGAFMSSYKVDKILDIKRIDKYGEAAVILLHFTLKRLSFSLFLF